MRQVYFSKAVDNLSSLSTLKKTVLFSEKELKDGL